MYISVFTSYIPSFLSHQLQGHCGHFCLFVFSYSDPILLLYLMRRKCTNSLPIVSNIGCTIYFVFFYFAFIPVCYVYEAGGIQCDIRHLQYCTCTLFTDIPYGDILQVDISRRYSTVLPFWSRPISTPPTVRSKNIPKAVINSTVEMNRAA